MIKPGYIRLIDGKIKFVYYELEKPLKKRYFYLQEYEIEMKKYEASKRLVEVSNVWKKYQYWYYMDWCLSNERVINNQLCKAEVNGTATIIELIK